MSYYPGAVQRYRRFAEVDPAAELTEFLPWTLLRTLSRTRNLNSSSRNRLFAFWSRWRRTPRRESFFRSAVDFANERLSGTLSPP